jgi:HTH-type transcriptional regulator/antitoxin HigA
MNPVAPPGITILENMSALNMTQQELAERMGRPVKTINEIIKGKTTITPETALQLEHVLGIPVNFWLNREARYHEYLERKREESLLSDAKDWVRLFPLKEMIKNGWVQKQDLLIDQAHELLNFFGIAKPAIWNRILKPYLSFRKSKTFECDEGSLAAWLRKGEIESYAVSCQPFEAKRFRLALDEIRGMTQKNPEEFVPMIQALCANAGVAVVFVRELPKTRVSGVTKWLGSEKALIQLSSRYKTDDHFWFTFFHEAGHILNNGKKEVFLEGNDFKNTQEEQADIFAADWLIEPAEYHAFSSMWPKKPVRLKQKMIEDFAKKNDIAPGIVVGRLQHDDKLDFKYYNKLKKTLVWPDSIMK